MTSMITRRRVLQTGVAAAALTAMPQTGFAADAVVKLRILETTDLHVNILPYDYYRDAADDTVGLARTATIVKAARSEAKNSLLFDNGDLIQGSPLGDFVAYRRGMKKGDVHPMVAAMNTLNYDCGTLGNHEFNYGLDFLQNSLGAAKFPIVCANVIKANGETLQKPWLVLDREVVDEAGTKHPIKIGVIGFVPPQIVQWDKAHLDGKATTIDIVDAAQKHVPDVKKAGADIVVALCHSGHRGRRSQGRRRKCGAASRQGRRHRRDSHRTPAFHLPGRQGIRQHSGCRCEGRHASRKACRHGGILGQPPWARRSRTHQGCGGMESREVRDRSAPDL